MVVVIQLEVLEDASENSETLDLLEMEYVVRLVVKFEKQQRCNLIIRIEQIFVLVCKMDRMGRVVEIC
jgi:hypothetical protein